MRGQFMYRLNAWAGDPPTLRVRSTRLVSLYESNQHRPVQSSAACSAGQSRIYALSMRFSKLCASSTARATS
jgi:hypothetical protein